MSPADEQVIFVKYIFLFINNIIINDTRLLLETLARSRRAKLEWQTIYAAVINMRLNTIKNDKNIFFLKLNS